jgi:cell division protease FtsH
MNRRAIQRILIGLLVIVFCFIGVKTLDIDLPVYLRELFIRTSNMPGVTFNKTQLKSSSKMTYGRFLEYLEMGWVNQVDLYDNNRRAIVEASSPELGNRPQFIGVDLPIGASQLIQKLKDSNISFDAHPAPQKSIFITIASNLLLPLIFIGSLIFFFQNSDNFVGNSSSSPMNLGKSTARFDQNPDTGISFDDIAGIDEAKAEFEEIVSFLKEPERYTLVGAKIPKGVLLIGPPGTGKTLLAKAIANEANVPFYSVAGSEFVEMFIGVGAARIRDLFKKAAENTPCIVFIDEIDAVGRERGAGIGGGNDEREQTLNQLLTEMDGFKENKGVIVVGATNRVDILDSALLRPGRFDRQITVGLPDRLGRIGILKVHAKNKPFDENVSLVQIANRTPGFSGADLANLLNEAAILATRYKKETITKDEVNEAADRIIGGIAGSTMEESKNKRLIAYHEVGHAIVGSVLEHHDDVEKVTLIPRGGAKGLTWFAPDEDQMLITRSELTDRIVTILGGRAAEQVIFGDPEITTGASNDLQQATNIARQMVTRYGMSILGPISLEPNNNEQFFFSGENNEILNNKVDKEVRKIINYCEQVAKEIVLQNRVVIDLAVEKLLDSETIEGNDFRQIVSEYTTIPNKK